MFDRPSLRPLDLSDLLDEAFSLYRANFALFAGVVAVLAVPEALINAVITLSEPTTTVHLANGINQTSTSSIGGVVMAGFVSFVFTILTGGALALTISYRYLRRPISIGEAYQRVGPARFVTLALTSIAAGIGVALGLILVLVPGIIVLVRWLFVGQAIVIEDKSFGSAFARSWDLTRGSFWRVTGYGLVFFIIVAVVQGVLGGLIAFLLAFGGGSGTRVASLILSAALGIVVRPFEFTALTLLYYDLRVRKEGLDLEIMSNQFGFGSISQ